VFVFKATSIRLGTPRNYATKRSFVASGA